MGTNVFFIESEKPREVDPNFHEPPPKLYEYLTKSNKVLKMNRIFVEEIPQSKSETIDSAQYVNKKDDADIEHLKVTKTYEEALNQFLRPEEKPPRNIAAKEIKCQDNVIDEIASTHLEEATKITKGNENESEPESEKLSQDIVNELNQLLSEDVEEPYIS